MRSLLVWGLVAIVAAAASAVPLQDSEDSAQNTIGKEPDREIALLEKLNSRCSSQQDTSACLMLKLVAYVNRLLKKADIPLGEGLEISQSREVVWESLGTSGRELGTEEEAVGSLVADKLWNFVRSRALRWHILPGTELVLATTPGESHQLSLDLSLREARSDGVEEGRGKMKNAGPLMMAAAMKVGMVGMLAFKALALLVGKALLVSKLAFLLATIIGLKKLFSGGQKVVTYEVVAHPHHSHSHIAADHGGLHGGGGGDSYSSGWGRSIQPTSADPQSLAYSAHTPK